MLRILFICAVAALVSSCGTTQTVDVAHEISSGTAALGGFRFDLARASFDRAARAAPAKSHEGRQAVLGQAVCAQHLAPVTAGGISEAVALYGALTAGDDAEAALATLHLGRICEQIDFLGDTIDLAGAREQYRTVIARWSEAPIAGEATVRLMGTYVQTLDPAQIHEGIALAQARLKSHPHDPWTGTLWQLVSETWLRPLGEKAKAVAALREAIRVGLPEPSRAWEMQWRLAQLSEDLHDTASAIAAYREIVLHYPTSGKAWEAQQAIIRLGQEPPPLRWFDTTVAEAEAEPEPEPEPEPKAKAKKASTP
jgi:tetratricopeptide (TPR) repeat protein